MLSSRSGTVSSLVCSGREPSVTRILPLANATGFYGGYATNDFNSSETFLRGGWYTDSNGIVEITTVYPGYYTGRTPHVHMMVHKSWTQSANGFVPNASLMIGNLD